MLKPQKIKQITVWYSQSLFELPGKKLSEKCQLRTIFLLKISTLQWLWNNLISFSNNSEVFSPAKSLLMKGECQEDMVIFTLKRKNQQINAFQPLQLSALTENKSSSINSLKDSNDLNRIQIICTLKTFLNYPSRKQIKNYNKYANLSEKWPLWLLRLTKLADYSHLSVLRPTMKHKKLTPTSKTTTLSNLGRTSTSTGPRKNLTEKNSSEECSRTIKMKQTSFQEV